MNGKAEEFSKTSIKNNLKDSPPGQEGWKAGAQRQTDGVVDFFMMLIHRI